MASALPCLVSSSRRRPGPGGLAACDRHARAPRPTAAARQPHGSRSSSADPTRLLLGGFHWAAFSEIASQPPARQPTWEAHSGGAHSQSASRSAGRAALAHLCSSTPCRWMGPKPVPIPGAAQRSPARAFPYPQFRDKNRRDIGKSQPKWTASKMEAAWFATAAGAAAGGAAAAVEAGCCQACGTCTRTRVHPHAHTPHVRLSHSHEMLVPPPRRRPDN
jgi:hypothetical protein